MCSMSYVVPEHARADEPHSHIDYIVYHIETLVAIDVYTY